MSIDELNADFKFGKNRKKRGNVWKKRFVLCAASAYEQKFYLNPQFESLPEAVRQELQIMCVLYTGRCGRHSPCRI